MIPRRLKDMWLSFSDVLTQVAIVLEAHANDLNERTAQAGLDRYAEGYRDGCEMTRAQQPVVVSCPNPRDQRTPDPDACGLLGCTLPKHHDVSHRI